MELSSSISTPGILVHAVTFCGPAQGAECRTAASSEELALFSPGCPETFDSTQNVGYIRIRSNRVTNGLLAKRTEDKSSTRRLRDYLRANFYLRNIAPGDKLVSHRELSRQLRISPTTALRLYEELENEGLLDTKERSGTFLKNVGIEADRPPREEEMFRLIRETAAKLISLEARPSQFSRLLQYYTGAAVREDFKIGFVAHSEAYELALRTAETKTSRCPLCGFRPMLGTEIPCLGAACEGSEHPLPHGDVSAS